MSYKISIYRDIINYSPSVDTHPEEYAMELFDKWRHIIPPNELIAEMAMATLQATLDNVETQKGLAVISDQYTLRIVNTLNLYLSGYRYRKEIDKD